MLLSNTKINLPHVFAIFCSNCAGLMRVFFLNSNTRYLVLMVSIVLTDIIPFMSILVPCLCIAAIAFKKLDSSGEEFYSSLDFGGCTPVPGSDDPEKCGPNPNLFYGFQQTWAMMFVDSDYKF